MVGFAYRAMCPDKGKDGKDLYGSTFFAPFRSPVPHSGLPEGPSRQELAFFWRATRYIVCKGVVCKNLISRPRVSAHLGHSPAHRPPDGSRARAPDAARWAGRAST